MTAAEYVEAYLRGEGRGDSPRDRALQQFAANHPAEVEREFRRRLAGDADEQRREEVVSALTTLAPIGAFTALMVVACIAWGVPALFNEHTDAGLVIAAIVIAGAFAGVVIVARLIWAAMRDITEGEDA